MARRGANYLCPSDTDPLTLVSFTSGPPPLMAPSTLCAPSFGKGNSVFTRPDEDRLTWMCVTKLSLYPAPINNQLQIPVVQKILKGTYTATLHHFFTA